MISFEREFIVQLGDLKLVQLRRKETALSSLTVYFVLFRSHMSMLRYVLHLIVL